MAIDLNEANTDVEEMHEQTRDVTDLEKTTWEIRQRR